MKNLFIIISLTTLIFISSCSKNDTDQTQAELTAAKLIKLFGSTSGTLTNGIIYINNETGKTVSSSASYSISSDGYITINSISFNLTYLTYYYVFSTSSPIGYELDFTGI